MKAYKMMPSLEDDEVAAAVIKKAPSNVDRNDPTTWMDSNWPTSQSAGFLGSDVAITKEAFNNRQNEKIYQVFRELIGKDDLWVSIDRYGIMRPTVDVPLTKLPDEIHTNLRTSVKLTDELIKNHSIQVQDRPEWKSITNWTHWDLNPWKWMFEKEQGLPYNYEIGCQEDNGTRNDGIVKLQGLVSFVDSREQDGGFCTVPGFHKAIGEWAERTIHTNYKKFADNVYSLVRVPKEDSLHKFLQKISVRAGGLVIWRGELAHCNFPNNSCRFRMNQYIKMFPAQEKGLGVELRRQEMIKMIPSELQLTDLGKKLFGLQSWNE